MPPPDDPLTLLDWKRRIFDLYSEIRRSDPLEGWQRWRAVRDEMFATHPQSPIRPHDRAGFEGLTYFDYDSDYRVLAEIEPATERRYEIGTSGDGTYTFTRFATTTFEVRGSTATLELYWLEGYGGGAIPSVPGRNVGSVHLWSGALPLRYGQGGRSGNDRGPPRARSQLRLQPLLQLRPALGVSAGSSPESDGSTHRGGGEARGTI